MADVMTVDGPVRSDGLGVVLPHEHLIIDLARVTRNFDHLLHDRVLAAQEAGRFAEAGGGTVVELTNRNLGRDPTALLEISPATGLHVVMGCGWYREPYYDREVYEQSTNSLAAAIVRDLTVGVDDSGIRAGIIGEIGSDDRLPISPAEERSFRAAARAHRATGVTVSTHAAFSRVGLDQLDLLEEEGVDPRRVIVGHAAHVSDPDYHEALAQRGCWVQFDRIRGPHEWEIERNVNLVTEMIRRGHLGRLLLSQDICMIGQLHAFGGTGYDFVLSQFVPRLRNAGLTEDDISEILVLNPRAALTGE